MIEIIKKNLAFFVQGVMFGFGFSIAAWIMYFAFQARMQESPNESPQNRDDSVPAISAPAKGNHFAFRKVEEVKRNGRSYFIGSVKNNGSLPAKGVSVEVNLFSKDKFVDQCSTYITGDIGPGEEKYFKVSCGCKDEQPAEHDNYKISIVGGY